MKIAKRISSSGIVVVCNLLLLIGMLFAQDATACSGASVTLPTTLKQPDGTELHLFVTGTRFHNRLHDEKNYTIVQNSYLYYEYATLSKGVLVPSGFRVGQVDPSTTGLQPGLEEKREDESDFKPERTRSLKTTGIGNDLPFLGTMNLITIFVRFQGEVEFASNYSSFDGTFNTENYSLKKYYQWNSYNRLTINTSFPNGINAPFVSYQDSHQRGYFEEYNATSNTIGYQTAQEAYDREHEMVKNASKAFKSAFPGLDLDLNKDGYIDLIYFMVSGTYKNGSVFWPHGQWMGSTTFTINSKTPNMYLITTTSHQRTDVICHEVGHVLGDPAPDVYGTYSLGSWDLMAQGINSTPPSTSMSAYMKWRYMRFIDNIPEITKSGTYTLSPLESTPQAYMIRSVNTNEFFVLEYRQRQASGFDSNIPGSGLLIYRINSALWGNGGATPEMYLYRPSGQLDATNAFYSAQSGRTSINSSTTPSAFLSDLITDGRLDITNITAAGNTISFTYTKKCLTETTGDAANISYTSGSVIPVLTATRGTIGTTGVLQMSANSNKSFESGTRINLRTGFRAVPGSGFHAGYYPCSFKAIPSITRMLENTTVQVSEEYEVEYNNDVVTSLIGALYPNPSDGQFNFEVNKKLLGLSYIEVYNSTGILVHRQAITDAEKSHQVDMVGQASGLYHLKVISGDESATKTFLIK
jgi:M6 family metalloprotease-like protein